MLPAGIVTIALALACALAAPPAGSAVPWLSKARALEPSDPAAAVTAYQKALELITSSGEAALEADSRLALGMTLRRAGRSAEGKAELERALDLFLASGDRCGIALARAGLGSEAYYSENAELARAHWLLALAEFEAMGDEREQSRILTNLAAASTGPLREGFLERAAALATRTGDRVRLAGIRRLQADDLMGAGRLKAAIDVLEEAQQLVEGYDGREPTNSILTSLGEAYSLHGAQEKALEVLRRSLARRRKTADRMGILESLNAIGEVLVRLSRPREAAEHFEQALELARTLDAHRVVPVVLGNLAEVRLSGGEDQRAAALLAEAIDSDQILPARRPLMQIQMAQAQLGLGRLDDARRWADLGLSGAERTGNVYHQIQGHLTRARILVANGQRDAAAGDTRRGLELLEETRPELVPDDLLKQEFARSGTARDFYAFAVDIFERQGLQEEALLTAERARSRAFLDLVATRSRETEPAVTAPRARFAKGPASTVTAPSATFAEIAATARRLRSTLVSTFVTPKATFVWVVSPGGAVRMVRLDVSQERLERLVSRARRGSSPDAWGQLYDTLIAPIRPWLKQGGESPGGRARLTVVPHGPLVALPFAALRGPDGRYLVEDFAIHSVPSASWPARPAGERASGTVIVADPASLPDALPPLPGSRREAQAVLAQRPGAQVLTGKLATKRNFRERAPNAALLHLATHALVRDDRPMESFLAFSPADGDDGRLTAGELYDLRFRADLVVLSACRSATGEPSADGVVGLTRAFLSAGVSAVVATAWDVVDEIAADFMKSFYRGLAKGRSRDRALRDAQLELLARLREGRLLVKGPLGPAPLPENPVHWAGFLLVGEP